MCALFLNYLLISLMFPFALNVGHNLAILTVACDVALVQRIL